MENIASAENLEEQKYNEWQDASNLLDNMVTKWANFIDNYIGHEGDAEKEEELKILRPQLEAARTKETETYTEWIKAVDKTLDEPEPE